MMDKNKIQKVNKALVATVFATSGITVAMPLVDTASAAGKTFKDVKTTSSHYENIIKLSARGIIGGYSDGTFRPGNSVTRGQAAKMLAGMLGLNVSHSAVKNPGFKDVPTTHQYYGYIAALENRGIMSGYSGTEKRFMPNEKITRGQMAKILVLGFNFEVASKFDHNFKDVTPQTSHAAYIQTLVNLKITKGVTSVSYEPFSPVTRGQMSSFLIRAEEERKTTTTYKITSIDSNYVYINSVPYKVASELKHILNRTNEAVLKGAFIEGKLSNGTINAVSKLTINASGSKSKWLEVNGNYKNFAGDIVVNGNYIRFKNINLTGTILLNETARQSLKNNQSYSNQLPVANYIDSNPLVASSSGYIDWSSNSQLTSMKDVEKYIEFVNCTVSKIIVAQDKTKIISDSQITRLDIISDVREIELQADVKTVNVKTETDLTIYGESDIELLNKNSFKDLQLYFDGTIDKLVVDNVYGWIDLGDETYVKAVILPKGETPNNVFDDYLEDHGNIDYIEDPDGNPIDKDPIENQKPADKTKPIVAITKAESANGSTAIVEFTSNEVGTYYYIVKEKGETAPTLRELVEQRPGNGAARGSGATGITTAQGTTPAKPMKLTITNLGEKKEYVIYLIVVDGSKNISEPVAQKSFMMKDSTLPVVTGIRGEGLHGGQRMKIFFTASEPGEYYYYVRKKTTAPVPTTAEIMANPTGKGTAVAGKLGITETVTGLSANSDYEIYVVMKDTSGNISKDPAAVGSGITGDLDNINPFVTGPGWPNAHDPLDKQLIPSGINQFYMYFNEELEKETAENIQNYDLSGTGIINISGQEVIKPAAVVYEKYGKGSRVLITVPSLTGFVNGDTLKATVLPGVKDLAANDFENKTTVNAGATPRNYADYRHDDTAIPVLNITKVLKNNSGTSPKVEVTFEASKAGTYYYMVMPESVDLTARGIKPRDFVDEFTSTPTGKFDSSNGKLYLSKSGNNPATLGSQKFDITETSALNPFDSYAVFMVLRDRSGQLSEIKRAQIINDSIAPDITGLGVKSKTNDDTKATITYNSNEKGSAYYWYVPKYVLVNGSRVLNPEIYVGSGQKKQFTAAEIKAKGQVKEMLSGSNAIDITGLSIHEDYVVYLATEDTFGNLTEKNVPSNVQRPVNPNTDGFAVPMISEFFSDGTKPKIGVGSEPWIKKVTEKEFTTIKQDSTPITYAENQTFVVTFSEAVKPELTMAMLTEKLEGTPGTSISAIEWEDTTNISTWNPRKLIIKFAAPVTGGFNFDMNKVTTTTITDLAGQEFIKPKAEYQYPLSGHVNKIEYARLQQDALLPAGASRKMWVNANVETDLSWNQTYYYATTQNSKQSLTKEETESIIEHAKNPNVVIPGNGIILYGTGPLNSAADGSFILDLEANQSTATGGVYNSFKVNQNVFLFTKDKYGNIVWAIHTGTSNNYAVIEPAQ